MISRNSYHPDIKYAELYIENILLDLGISVEKQVFQFSYGGQVVEATNIIGDIVGTVNPDNVYCESLPLNEAMADNIKNFGFNLIPFLCGNRSFEPLFSFASLNSRPTPAFLPQFISFGCLQK